MRWDIQNKTLWWRNFGCGKFFSKVPKRELSKKSCNLFSVSRNWTEVELLQLLLIGDPPFFLQTAGQVGPQVQDGNASGQSSQDLLPLGQFADQQVGAFWLKDDSLEQLATENFREAFDSFSVVKFSSGQRQPRQGVSHFRKSVVKKFLTRTKSLT